jgi:hypothetical protein
VYGSRPVGAFGTLAQLESVCLPLLRLTLGRRTVLQEWTIVALLSEKLESCASGSLVGGCGECDTLEQQT